MNLLSPELREKALSLPHPTINTPTGLHLPDAQELEDARWQQEHAGQKVAEFINALKAALPATPPTDPTDRARYERNDAFLRSLEFFFQANAHLLTLLDQREEEMRESMAEAQFNYRQMRLDRDFYRHEVQATTKRYHHETNLAALLAKHLPQLDPARA